MLKIRSVAGICGMTGDQFQFSLEYESSAAEQRVFFSAADKRRRFAGHVESGRTAERTELYRSGENQRYSIYRRRNVSGYSDGNRC